MIEEISITVITPTTTPIIVKNERSLFERKVAIAILKFSINELPKNFITMNLVGAKCLNRVKPRRFPRGEKSCRDSDDCRNSDGDNG